MASVRRHGEAALKRRHALSRQPVIPISRKANAPRDEGHLGAGRACFVGLPLLGQIRRGNVLRFFSKFLFSVRGTMVSRYGGQICPPVRTEMSPFALS